MAHFVEIDENNIVLRVLVVDDADCLDADGNESEAVGKAYLEDSLGGTWLQTSYNSHHGGHDKGKTCFRKNYAGAGYTYDADKDAFIPPNDTHPANYVLDEDICDWMPPTARPDDGKDYTWNNDREEWAEVEFDADGNVLLSSYA